jgi:hypothetical protein
MPHRLCTDLLIRWLQGLRNRPAFDGTNRGATELQEFSYYPSEIEGVYLTAPGGK